MVEKDLQLISCLIIRPIQVLESYGQFKIFWNFYLFPIEQMSTIVELCSRVAGYTKTICEHSCNLLLSRIEESVQTFSILLDICYEKLGPGFADLSVFWTILLALLSPSHEVFDKHFLTTNFSSLSLQSLQLKSCIWFSLPYERSANVLFSSYFRWFHQWLCPNVFSILWQEEVCMRDQDELVLLLFVWFLHLLKIKLVCCLSLTTDFWSFVQNSCFQSGLNKPHSNQMVQD